jgi:CRP-like cAMP-binding protein
MAQKFLLQKSQINDLHEKICYNLEKGGNVMEKHITLFTDILPEEQERMRVCFHAREDIFRNGETIMEYSRSMNKIGLVLYGRAILYCCDEEGNEYMIDELKKNAVFGEPFLLPADSQHYYVTAEEETNVMFIDYEHMIKRCEKACHHHSQMVSNLLQMTAMQSRQQMERIYVLSRATTRKKLLAYLNNLSIQIHSRSIQIPMSYTALAQYLTVDRSAMTRELKNLEKEGILTKKGRNIRLWE